VTGAFQIPADDPSWLSSRAVAAAMGMSMGNRAVSPHRVLSLVLSGVLPLMALPLPAALAQAQSSATVDFAIAPQSLASALIEYSKQAHVQVLTSGANLENAKSPGVSGKLSASAGLRKLLEGTAFGLEFTDANTVVVKPASARPAAAEPAPAKAAAPQKSDDQPPQELEKLTVTGSRIPRAQVEGPAPVVTITAADIRNNGFANTYDIMTSLTQNLGNLDNNANTNGFSSGAIGVDLRGLGPNHTLVLVNGRRIADYPQSYKGNSNFTDISNIPASMIDRVEILSGSASAVYGSDAVSGVINFILKQKVDGTTVDLRVGDTQHGGASSQRLQITSGWSSGNFDSVFSLELLNKSPLWAYQRSYADSKLDSPVPTYPSQVFTRIDENGDYIDPGKETCDALSHLDRGSVFYAYRKNYGYYCGSNQDVGYGTLENGRKAANFYGTATYHFNDHLDFFLDLQAGTSHQEGYNTPLQWQNSYALNGDSTPVPFYNLATGRIEQWQRRYFTIEENGGFERGKIRNINNTYSLNTGVKGSIPDTGWTYEALFSHSQNQLESKWPALISAKAQALYLGPSLGIDPDSGYQIYNAPISRLYTPLTVDEFRSITQDSIDHDFSRAENFSATLTNTELFHLPAGPVGFAAVAEYGNQYYGLKPDPLSLDGTYYGLHNTGAVGSRDHTGAGMELNVPVFSMLNVNAATRYDRYEYSSTSSGKFTWSLGLEFRPFDSLLLRGSAGTGFRAPDLSYLYAGLSGSSSSAPDYYYCRKNEPDVDIGDCSRSDVDYNGRSHGSTALKNETSRSFTYGFVYSPVRGLDITADYYNIRLKNEVLYQDSDMILRQEADCRLGVLDIHSALCQQVLTQVVRNPETDLANPLGITSVLVLPINAAVDRTSGIDFKAHYKWETDRAGTFDFDLGYTYVISHTLQQFPGDPVVDELKDLYNYVIPRDKTSYSVTWNYDKFTTTLYGYRLGGLPDYDGTQRLAPTFVYNGSFNYRWNDALTLSLIVDNLFDKEPRRKGDWTSYPYYPNRWYSPLGRSFFVQANYRFGGSRN
jgi:outer membrane receptor protein involved in Fe transport